MMFEKLAKQYRDAPMQPIIVESMALGYRIGELARKRNVSYQEMYLQIIRLAGTDTQLHKIKRVVQELESAKA